MTKLRGGDSRRPRKVSAPPGSALPALIPNPPKRRPWFLALAAIAMALWLIFLAWMAWEASR